MGNVSQELLLLARIQQVTCILVRVQCICLHTISKVKFTCYQAYIVALLCICSELWLQLHPGKLEIARQLS